MKGQEGFVPIASVCCMFGGDDFPIQVMTSVKPELLSNLQGYVLKITSRITDQLLMYYKELLL